MTRALLGKELREHKWILAAITVLLGGAEVAAFLVRRGERSALMDLQLTIAIYASIVALVMANRLVVREYSARTQLFLEALPLTRARVFGVKWALGAALTVGFMEALAAIALVLDREHTVLSAEYVVPVIVRIGLFSLFAHAVAFLAAVFGRYRYVFWLTAGFGLYALDQYAQQPVSKLPPMKLVGEGLLTERGAWPLVPLLLTALFVLLALAAAATLMLAREGIWVSALARRMSYREKIGVGVAALVPLVLIAMFDKRKDRPKFDLAEAVKGSADDVVVGIARPPELSTDSAQELAEHVAKDLAGVRAYLGLEALPAVFIVPDASLDADVFLRATLPAADGVVVKGALGSPHFDELEFRAFTVHQIIEWYTRGRAEIEERHFLLDGFSQWWVARDSGQVPMIERRARAAAQRMPIDDAAIARWFSSSESLGDCLIDALGYEAIATLAQQPDKLQAMLRDAWSKRPPKDIRALFGTQSGEGLLEKHFGLTRAAFAAELSKRVEALPTVERADWQPTFNARRMRGTSYEIHYGFDGGTPGPPEFAIRYETLTPWKNYISRDELSRVDAMAPGVLPLTVQRGARVFVAAEAHDDALNCTVRAGARRWVIP